MATSSAVTLGMALRFDATNDPQLFANAATRWHDRVKDLGWESRVLHRFSSSSETATVLSERDTDDVKVEPVSQRFS
jgi:hypothetical protein